MTVIFITLIVATTLVSFVAHEAAHALALRKHGIPIAEAGIGFGKPRVTFRTRQLPFPVTFTPFPVGAYVRLTPEGMNQAEKLSYRDYAWLAGAGVVMNLGIGGMLLAVVFALQGSWLLVLAASIAVGLLWVGRVWFTAYAIPLLGFLIELGILVAIVTLGWRLVTDEATSADGGLRAIGDLLSYWVGSGAGCLTAIATINIALAVGNLVPLYPADGGRIFSEIVRRQATKKRAEIFQVASFLYSKVIGVAAFALVVCLVVVDIVG